MKNFNEEPLMSSGTDALFVVLSSRIEEFRGLVKRVVAGVSDKECGDMAIRCKLNS